MIDGLKPSTNFSNIKVQFIGGNGKTFLDEPIETTLNVKTKFNEALKGSLISRLVILIIVIFFLTIIIINVIKKRRKG